MKMKTLSVPPLPTASLAAEDCVNHSGIVPPDTLIKKKKHNRQKNACTNCRKAKKRCGSTRPCLRCVRTKKSHSCCDVVGTERTKRYKNCPSGISSECAVSKDSEMDLLLKNSGLKLSHAVTTTSATTTTSTPSISREKFAPEQQQQQQQMYSSSSSSCSSFSVSAARSGNCTPPSSVDSETSFDTAGASDDGLHEDASFRTLFSEEQDSSIFGDQKKLNMFFQQQLLEEALESNDIQDLTNDLADFEHLLQAEVDNQAPEYYDTDIFEPNSPSEVPTNDRSVLIQDYLESLLTVDNYACKEDEFYTADSEQYYYSL